MATIKPIEGRSVHQIQSGQVIVDLCSVVKELVENSLDAGSTSIEIRFRNSGLDSVEVQDNGNGIAPEDFESLALKHHTSKLLSYEDLGNLNTFGFRGEALSSLCGLSTFYVITARAVDGPKGTRLDFETSGKLKSISVVASTKGTTVTVEQIFKNLPVRRKELERNIRREYQKVLNLLNAYACISVGVRFVVSNVVAKGKRNVVFSTNASASVRDNIASVFSAKTLQSLLPLNLKLELRPSILPNQSARNWHTEDDPYSKEVHITGFISRPVVGEGRQTADRQLFFVNSRPCGLPQVAKAINEVYRSYNITQTPFIFANLKMDTHAYDVNVSPDKRTILLHDQSALLEAFKEKLVELFDAHEQSVPDSMVANRKLPTYQPLNINKPEAQVAQNTQSLTSRTRRSMTEVSEEEEDQEPQPSLMSKYVADRTIDRETVEKAKRRDWDTTPAKILRHSHQAQIEAEMEVSVDAEDDTLMEDYPSPPSRRVRDFNRAVGAKIGRNSDVSKDLSDYVVAALPESDVQQERSIPPNEKKISTSTATEPEEDEEPISSSIRSSKRKPTPTFQSSLDRMLRQRVSEDPTTVTIGETTIVTITSSPQSKRRKTATSSPSAKKSSVANPTLLKSLRSFAAPGTQFEDVEMNEANNSDIIQPESKQIDVASSSSESERLSKESNEEISDDDPGDEPEAEQSDKPEESDDEFVDESEKKAREEAKVAQLIADAEKTATHPTEENIRRATSILKAQSRKDATLQCLQIVKIDIESLEHARQKICKGIELSEDRLRVTSNLRRKSSADEPEEERLALTISKADFGRMQIVGQFNLGFILALRPAQNDIETEVHGKATDELFIIDQHASDEKYNFERLQAETTVQNQPLVHPKHLELTAVEEELLINNPIALAKNGFSVEVDMSGNKPVGRRCKLISLPMSKEVVFDDRDLEELLALLMGAGDYEGGGMLTSGVHEVGDSSLSSQHVPRPSKVRRMFAMRACRSSIMVGRNLTKRHMAKVVRHMGEIDKPWNCPHGRPTMRHLFGLDAWRGWQEGEGLVGMEEWIPPTIDWNNFVQDWKQNLDGDSGEEYCEEEQDMEEDEEEEEEEEDEEGEGYEGEADLEEYE